MRIVSGTHRGRVIHAPKNLPVRPTTDFAKESLFNILNNHFEWEDSKVLDLFCGTGNITYEFASRGCESVTSVDVDYGCCEFVKKSIVLLKMNQVKVTKSDAIQFLKRIDNTYNIIFADPPYSFENFELIPELVFSKNLLKEDGWLIIEHGEQTNFSTHNHFREQRTYGNVNFSIFVNS